MTLNAMRPLTFRRRPCADCPWLQHTDLTVFSDGDFAKLAASNGIRGSEAAPSAPLMSCHRDQPGTNRALRLCAGWLAVVGADHLGVRMALISGRLPTDVTAPKADWPPLHPGLETMIEARHRQFCSGPGSPPDGRLR